jgi:superfamily II DNA/RNA helicase
MTFSSLGLSAPLVRAVTESHYLTPTPVQAAAIPPIFRGSDVLVSAQTGSGKTAAYVLPVLERLAADRRPLRHARVLVLVPTRELAVQVGAAIRTYSRFFARPFRTQVLFGGVSLNPQMMALRGGADVVVASPGRLLDLVARNALKLGDVEMLVLDEADRLLAAGFADELAAVLRQLPARRQTLLFSATLPPEVEALAGHLLQSPVRIDVPATPETAPDIRQRVIEVDAPRRTQLLIRLIREAGWERVLVFVATKYATEHVAEKLRKAGLSAGALHGDLSQGTRLGVLDDFAAGRLAVLLATDVAARGLDIVGLPAVVNFDLPRSTDDYVHRIGRTGRAGAAGTAVSFVSAATHAHFRLIEKRHGLALPREQVPGFEPVEMAAPPPPAGGGVKGRRKSKKDKAREAAGEESRPRVEDPARLVPTVSWTRRLRSDRPRPPGR